MRIGLTLPNRGILFGATTVDTMLQLAEEADRSGLFDAVWVGDSLLGKPRLESISLLAAVAGRTKRVRLGTACMASFAQRVTRLIEWIQILRLLWTTDNASFDGREYKFEGISIDPKPVQKPAPPIWIANNAPAENRGLVERTHRRAVTHGEGWQTSIWDPEDLEWRVKDIIEKTKEVGKDPDKFERSVYHNININEDEEAAVEESRRFL